MSEPMTRAELDEIRERCEAATPGPWEWKFKEKNEYGATARGLSGADLESVIGLDDEWRGYPECGQDIVMDIDLKDAAFIAISRTAVPRLLDEVARLQKDNEGLRANAMIQESIIGRNGNPALEGQNVRLTIDNARLISELEAFRRRAEDAEAIIAGVNKCETCLYGPEDIRGHDKPCFYCDLDGTRWEPKRRGPCATNSPEPGGEGKG